MLNAEHVQKSSHYLEIDISYTSPSIPSYIVEKVNLGVNKMKIYFLFVMREPTKCRFVCPSRYTER